MTGGIEDTKQYFDAIANGYSERSQARGWQSNAVCSKLLGSLGCAPQAVLDLGAGAGDTVAEIATRFPRARITAIDVSGRMVEQLRQRYPDNGQYSFEQAGAAEYLGRKGDSFDLVTAVSVLPFIAEPRIVMDGVAGRLKSGGLFVFTYEPITPGHATQHERQTRFFNNAARTQTMVYRQYPDEIISERGFVRQSGLTIAAAQMYHPLPQEDPGLQAGIVAARKL